jgi:hypothetical protein
VEIIILKINNATCTLGRNSVINEVNWSILLASGKEIKRDSISNVNENRFKTLK